jgi:hypothetical protein
MKLPDNLNNVHIRFEDGSKGIGYYAQGGWWVFDRQDEEWAKSHICESSPEGIFERTYPAEIPVSSWASIPIYVPADLWNSCTHYVNKDSRHSLEEIDALITLLEEKHTERGDLLADELASWKDTEP